MAARPPPLQLACYPKYLLTNSEKHHLPKTPLSQQRTSSAYPPPGVNLWLVHQFHYFDPILTNPGVTRGHARWWHLSSISCKNHSQNGGLQLLIWSVLGISFCNLYKRSHLFLNSPSLNLFISILFSFLLIFSPSFSFPFHITSSSLFFLYNHGCKMSAV